MCVFKEDVKRVDLCAQSSVINKVCLRRCSSADCVMFAIVVDSTSSGQTLYHKLDLVT